MSQSNSQIHFISPLEAYRPRRYADTYHGVDEGPVSEMVAQERERDYSQHLALLGPTGSAKTSLARIRGACRGCVKLDIGSWDPCGSCNHCRNTFRGLNTRLGAYHEIDCAQSGWLEEVHRLVNGGFGYHQVSGRKDHELRWIVVLDELQRAAKIVQQGLLKTVEDAIRIQFIICSTDRDAILTELLERCLVLKLEPPTAAQYSAWLKRILQAERITCEGDVIEAFDRGTNRGVRNTLSAIRPLTRTGKHIKCDAVDRYFGQQAVGNRQADSRRW